jgi:hypothetical protein
MQSRCKPPLQASRNHFDNESLLETRIDERTHLATATITTATANKTNRARELSMASQRGLRMGDVSD